LVVAFEKSAQRAADIDWFALERARRDRKRSGRIAVLHAGDIDAALAVQRDFATDTADTGENLSAERIELDHEITGAADGAEVRPGVISELPPMKVE